MMIHAEALEPQTRHLGPNQDPVDSLPAKQLRDHDLAQTAQKVKELTKLFSEEARGTT